MVRVVTNSEGVRIAPRAGVRVGGAIRQCRRWSDDELRSEGYTVDDVVSEPPKPSHDALIKHWQAAASRRVSAVLSHDMQTKLTAERAKGVLTSERSDYFDLFLEWSNDIEKLGRDAISKIMTDQITTYDEIDDIALPDWTGGPVPAPADTTQ